MNVAIVALMFKLLTVKFRKDPLLSSADWLKVHFNAGPTVMSELAAFAHCNTVA